MRRATGSSRRRTAGRICSCTSRRSRRAASAVRPEHFELLDREAAEDVTLAWQVQIRRASLGRYDAEAVHALDERDPDPESGVRALAVAAAFVATGIFAASLVDRYASGELS